MTNEVTKHRDKHDSKSVSSNKSDMIYYGATAGAVVLALVLVPKILGALGVSFLASGAGLNKLFSVAAAVGLGWFCIKPSQGYKDFMELAKGARTEWRKTVKPERDTVMRTTMMVLALVAVFAVLILILDGIFGSIVRAIVS